MSPRPTSKPPRERIDRASLRAQIAEMSPDDCITCFVVLLEAAAEHARELKLAPEEFVKSAVDAYCEAHDKRVITFECAEEPMIRGTGGLEVVLALGAKWSKS